MRAQFSENEGTAPPILNFGLDGESGQVYAAASSLQGMNHPRDRRLKGPVEPVWTLYRRKRFLILPGIEPLFLG
jgi:hypothetical protein